MSTVLCQKCHLSYDLYDTVFSFAFPDRSSYPGPWQRHTGGTPPREGSWDHGRKARYPAGDRETRVLTPGMGAVSSTFVAGVEAVRQGLRLPIGSLTQMGHIRLGKRTEGRQPLVRNFLPLADIQDIVFGGWTSSPTASTRRVSRPASSNAICSTV